jgi:adenine nucleotide transporter 17
VQAIKEMYQEGGLSRFYVSLDAYLIGALQPAIQFTLYDQIKNLLMKARAKRGLAAELSTLQAFLLGVFSSSIAATLLYPVDVVRTMVQTRSKKSQGNKDDDDDDDGAATEAGFVQVAQGVMRREGIAGLFKGLGPHLVQQVMSATVLLMVKERIADAVREMLINLAMKIIQRRMAAKAAARRAAKATAAAAASKMA